jgi:hypothetical protein
MLPDFRKSITLFEGSQALPFVFLITVQKMISMEQWKTEVLGEKHYTALGVDE